MLVSAGAVLAQSTVLKGRVTDDTGEALIGASVKVLKGTEFVRGAITDYNGDYRIPLDPGSYNVEISYTGFKTSLTNGVRVLVNTLNPHDVKLESGTLLNEVVVTDFKVPLIEQDKTQGGQTLTSDQIKNLPTRSVNAIVATTAGTTSIDGGDVNIKGSRSNATNVYVDGIRISGNSANALPVQDIEQLQVVTGGLGAEYGDVTGGVISIVTKGPASEYHGAIEVENSKGLDPYGWFLGTANVSGPLLKRKGVDGKPDRTLIGFRLSAQYLDQKDDDPPALNLAKVSGTAVNWDEVNWNNYYSADEAVANAERAKLEQQANAGGTLGRLSLNPLSLHNCFVTSTAESYTQDSVDFLKYNPYEGRKDLNLTAKLDFRLAENMDLSLTGTYNDRENQFTPAPTTGSWRVLNSQNNPTQYSERYRGIARFRHRLGSSEGAKDAASANRVSISNASYTLQFGFERGNSLQYDPRHGDNFFNYGYIGRFNYDYVPFVNIDAAGDIKHIDNTELYTGYQAGYVNAAGNIVVPNPGLNAYNVFAQEDDFNTFLNTNGRFNNTYDDIWSSMFTNVNSVFNTYQKSEDDILTGIASASFDLKLGKTGTHTIQFGLLTEQRTNRDWNLAPRNIWNLMNLVTNNHFNGLDTVVIGRIWHPICGPVTGDSTDIYANAVVNLDDFRFYRKIREQKGIPLSQWLNPNSLSPEELSLNMFSPRELTDQNLISYYGYDYLGEKLSNNITFNDFFTSTDADGIRDFPVAPLRPLYQAAYLKDKFTFNNMIFSLGLRVERFDLNSKVMKDQYSLYQVMNARDYYATQPNAGNRPGTIGDDYKVYVTSQTETDLKAFRNGETWYFPDGTQAPDGNVIFGGGGVVAPFLDDTESGDDILDLNFDPNSAFEDYTPQVNWLPRLAFSFPISDEANFFAHYDVLVQRPPSNWEVTPLDYLYFYTPTRTPENNANLKPERVVDYEVGFQQRLNQNSALKFSAYYREMRDMLQRRTILFVPTIGSYDTYGNIDFGTVKGFTLQYDLRRIQNAELRLAYTLQFADGTGSDINSQRGLTSRGTNIRTLSPLSFDERHNIQAILDYRFSSGKRYNGPRIAGKDILSNFGANLQLSAASGRPYTARLRPERFGGSGTLGAINGSRLPWRVNLDLRLDKSFTLVASGKNPLNLNVYFRVSNLLNQKNIVGVYSVTGSPTDDGFLATGEGQSLLNGLSTQGRDVDAYLSAYSWGLLNPDRYTQPRRIFIGAALEF
jgi:outer membrane receptor protein involved in Fe transport